METSLRKPFQGVMNVIRFNWHFYVIASSVIGILFLLQLFLSKDYTWIANTAVLLILLTTLFSLTVSYYVYDYSGLYNFEWMKSLNISERSSLVNINAGFDETSMLLKTLYPKTTLEVFDFYDPEKHTEVSIERARKAYASYPDVRHIRTDHVPLKKNSVDFIFNIFSIHEIRNREERMAFLKQLNESLKIDGRCVVVEHLRDVPNFFAYNIGFFHFYSPHEWRYNFSAAGFEIEKEIRITPFVSGFILKKNNGDTP